MTDLRFSAFDGASVAPSSSQTGERAGFFHRLIEALHHSRRLQAAQVVRRYRHLVDPACGYQLPSEPTKGSSTNVSQ